MYHKGVLGNEVLTIEDLVKILVEIFIEELDWKKE